jgi:hypothetical protein
VDGKEKYIYESACMRILEFGVIMGIWKQSVYQCRDGNVQTPFFLGGNRSGCMSHQNLYFT